ncbi:hypothetical protein BH23GEM6_BH23GEM6_03140 [soil metagenome]
MKWGGPLSTTAAKELQIKLREQLVLKAPEDLRIREYEEVGQERGCTSDIRLEGEVVGRVVRTRSGVRPLFISPGHLMDLDTAVEIVLRVTRRYREPETTRSAHQLVNGLRRNAGE